MTKIAAVALSVCISAGLQLTRATAAQPTAPSSPNTWTILSSPIQVDAVLEAKSAEGFHFTFELHGKQGEQSLRTFVHGDTLDQALMALRGDVVREAPYLFVTTPCDCNGSARRAVFKVNAGNVIPIGQLLALGPVTTSYHDGRFYDSYGGGRPPNGGGAFYDWGLCMACNPSVSVVMVESEGHFRVLPGPTWEANRPAWEANQRIIARYLSGTEDNPMIYGQAIDENAVLAKYCGHNRALAQLLEAVKRKEPSAMRDLTAGLATVPVLEPPSATRAAW